MERYRSHKIVEAAPIWHIETETPAEVHEPRRHFVLVDTDGIHFEKVYVPDNFTARGVPQKGDYLVRYTDQDPPYLSWSPKDVFEAGYTRVLGPKDYGLQNATPLRTVE